MRAGRTHSLLNMWSVRWELHQLGDGELWELRLSYLPAPVPLKVCAVKEAPQRGAQFWSCCYLPSKWGAVGGVVPPDQTCLFYCSLKVSPEPPRMALPTVAPRTAKFYSVLLC